MMNAPAMNDERAAARDDTAVLIPYPSVIIHHFAFSLGDGSQKTPQNVGLRSEVHVHPAADGRVTPDQIELMVGLAHQALDFSDRLEQPIRAAVSADLSAREA